MLARDRTETCPFGFGVRKSSRPRAIGKRAYMSKASSHSVILDTPVNCHLDTIEVYPCMVFGFMLLPYPAYAEEDVVHFVKRPGPRVVITAPPYIILVKQTRKAIPRTRLRRHSGSATPPRRPPSPTLPLGIRRRERVSSTTASVSNPPRDVKPNEGTYFANALASAFLQLTF
jgi:hypothetical protein